jgi:hypothetical protein
MGTPAENVGSTGIQRGIALDHTLESGATIFVDLEGRIGLNWDLMVSHRERRLISDQNYHSSSIGRLSGGIFGPIPQSSKNILPQHTMYSIVYFSHLKHCITK